MHQTLSRRRELSKTHTTLGEDLSSLGVNEISLIVDDFAYANLGDFDTAGEAWAGIAVKSGILADAVTASLEKSVFFGVKAQASRKIRASFCGTIAARASASIAVGHTPGGAIVAGTDDPLLSHNDTTNASLHAITPVRGKVCKLHEVLVPARA